MEQHFICFLIWLNTVLLRCSKTASGRVKSDTSKMVTLSPPRQPSNGRSLQINAFSKRCFYVLPLRNASKASSPHCRFHSPSPAHTNALEYCFDQQKISKINESLERQIPTGISGRKNVLHLFYEFQARLWKWIAQKADAISTSAYHLHKPCTNCFWILL